MVGFMNNKYYAGIFLLAILAIMIVTLWSEKSAVPQFQENGEALIWPTYKHDFSRMGNPTLKNYELKSGPSLDTMGSNAPENVKRNLFDSGTIPSSVFVDIDHDDDDELITYYKNTVYNKQTHERPFMGYVMRVDYKEKPTLLEKLEFGELPFIRKWYFAINDEIHTSFAVGDIDSDNVQEVVFGSDDGYLYALNGNNGDLKWKFKTGDKIRSSPTLFMDESVRIVFGNDDKKVSIVNGNGKKVCSFQTEDVMRSSPLIFEDNVVFSDFGKNIYFISKKCTLQKKHKTSGNILGSGAIFENKVVFASNDGYLYFFDTIGQQSKVNIQTPSISTPVSVNNEFILVSTTDGDVIFVNDTDTQIKWSNNKTGEFSCSPAIGVIKSTLLYSCTHIKIENNYEYSSLFINPFVYDFVVFENS